MSWIDLEIPDEQLVDNLKAVAKRRGWTLEETLLRGAKLLVETEAREAMPDSEASNPPDSSGSGGKV